MIQNLLGNSWVSDRPLRIDGIVHGSHVSSQRSNSQNPIDRFSSIFEAVGQNTTVKVLILSNLQLARAEADCFLKMLRHNKTLTTLEMGNVSFDDTEGCDVGNVLVEAFSISTSIKNLKLETCEIASCDTLRKLLDVQSSLKVLQLYRVPGVARLLDPATRTLPHCFELERLDICGCSLRDDQVHGLLTALLKSSSIEWLQLDRNQLGSEWTARILRSILLRSTKEGQSSTSQPRLKHLSLASNNFSGKAIGILADALSGNTTLGLLRLSNNPVGDEGAIALAHALKYNTTLCELELSHAEIWHQGCLAICRAFPSMAGLATLRVDGNDFESCLPNILAGLEKNTRLKTFLYSDVDHSHDDSKDQEDMSMMRRKIQLFLQLNRAKRRILLEPQILPGVWPLVLARATQVTTRKTMFHFPDALYYLLREQPYLIEWGMGNVMRRQQT